MGFSLKQNGPPKLDDCNEINNNDFSLSLSLCVFFCGIDFAKVLTLNIIECMKRMTLTWKGQTNGMIHIKRARHVWLKLSENKVD